MSDSQMKRAVRMNGWCFAGDERTIQTSLQKLIEKGLEVQLTLDDALVGKLLVEMTRRANGELTLDFKIKTSPETGFELASSSIDLNGQSVFSGFK